MPTATEAQDTKPDLCPETLQALWLTLTRLLHTIETEGASLFDQWQPALARPAFSASALNLAHYLVLRRQDLRALQADLMPWGLSSLGRIESRVIPNLKAVIATLEVMSGRVTAHAQIYPPVEAFFEGSRRLHCHTEELFGPAGRHRHVRIMVTLPSEAATEGNLVLALAQRGAQCFRINCAHDSADLWAAMVGHIRHANQVLNTDCKVLMDLGGPKIRTGEVLTPPTTERVYRGDHLLLTPAVNPDWRTTLAHGNPTPLFQVTCTWPGIFEFLRPGTLVYIDDGKIRTRVVDIHHPVAEGQTACLLQVTHASPKGVKLRPEKGLNFPNTLLPIQPLTEKDLQDLEAVVALADMVGYSFVQQPEDMDWLQQELDRRSHQRTHPLGIIAKIETSVAVSNLPELIIRGAGRRPFGVMIARGDLAVEIGYQRLAEIQEEILWVCEAAHVPVIWATQVLESLVKRGAPSRGEMTDAAMAERAECVMLNKGPFIAEAVTILDDVLTRMETHQLKKTPQLRALHSW